MEDELVSAAAQNAGDAVSALAENAPEAGQALKLTAWEETLFAYAEKIGIAAAVVAGQILLIWLIGFLFKKISAKVKTSAGKRIKPLSIKSFKILTTKQIEGIILFFLTILKYFVIIVQLFITIPVVFSQFPATKNLSSTIFAHIINPLERILRAMAGYIPNIITIVIILFIVKYLLRALKFFAKQIDKGKLVLPGFYPDWAWPTFNILRIVLYAFTAAVIYPYLPGSDSRAFQGISVFVGIIFSLGSSSAIGNLVAGLVLTYMRPFKIGDRIKIKDVIGFVVEKSPFVVRLRNIKNENITFPNLTVLNSEVVNFNTSGEEDGLILHAEVTMGYSVPWRDVYDVLVRAAAKTPHIEESPKPFVLQRRLDDFYAHYEINAYTKEIEKVLLIYSLLYQNIQDEFKNAGISMYCPHFYDISGGAPGNQFSAL